MANSPRQDQVSDPTVAKLLEVDAALASQAADLTAQLQSVQEKRKSLKSVINMFGLAETATNVASSVPTLPSETNGKAEQAATQEEITSEVSGLQAPAANDSNRQVAPKKPKQKVQKASASTNRKQTAKLARASKTAKKTEGWQQYLRDDFSDIALPDAVSIVLQEQSDQVLGIAEVVDAIFVAEMPPQVRVKARERVSNILSEGVRKNRWYRGQEGKYSMSSAARG